jgi:para-aminobenzoate synthetase/4-amino-4-deoxychorismate lyase
MPPYALIHDPETCGWLCLEDPLWISCTHAPNEIRTRLTEGFKRTDTLVTLCCLAYEAGVAFDPGLRVLRSPSWPLLWMAGFGRITRATTLEPLIEWAGDSEAREVLFGPWQAEMCQDAYARAFAAIKAHLAAGNAYQVNLTQRYRAPLLETPTAAGLRQLFLRLMRQYHSPHAALIDTGDFALLSFSPETFFQRHHHQVRCYPMKGTAARGQTAAQDRQAAQQLQNSPKEQAENRMIVDMVRNDLGRIARVGSVGVPRLFAVEHYPTVHQMISEVMAETRVSDADLLGALFPPASVTGAPKVAATGVIAEIENSPRGFYTGAIGIRLASGRSDWSVAIRTLAVDRRAGTAEYGSGGGIVWDSQVDRELAELQLKARVLADTRAQLGLVETLLLQTDGHLFLLERHLQRLRASARVFGFSCDEALIRQHLDAKIHEISSPRAEPQVLRLVLTGAGTVSLSHWALSERPQPTPLRLRLAERPIDSRDLLLRHKTTDRRVYRTAIGRSLAPGEEVLLFNERHELTEGSFTNLVLELDGHWYTPPVTAGLLPGCYRAELLAAGRIVERTLTPADLEQASAVWAVNSVRGMMACTIAA